MTFVLDYATDYRRHHLHHDDIDALHSSKKKLCALYAAMVCAHTCIYREIDVLLFLIASSSLSLTTHLLYRNEVYIIKEKK